MKKRTANIGEVARSHVSRMPAIVGRLDRSEASQTGVRAHPQQSNRTPTTVQRSRLSCQRRQVGSGMCALEGAHFIGTHLRQPSVPTERSSGLRRQYTVQQGCGSLRKFQREREVPVARTIPPLADAMPPTLLSLCRLRMSTSSNSPTYRWRVE